MNTPWPQIQTALRNPDLPEDDELSSWLEEDASNRKMLNDLKDLYAITGNVPEPFVPEKTKAWEKIGQRISKPKRSRLIPRTLIQIAASVLLVALGLGGGMFLRKNDLPQTITEVFSPYGHKTFVLLPDSSQVWLNGNSRIKYYSNFANGRTVQLSGEALFKVAKDPQRIFTVNSQSLRVEVHGTTFDVKTYPDDAFAEVALAEGCVKLFHDEQLLKELSPGEVASFDAVHNIFSCTQGNINQITSWRADELVIENQTFETIAKYLERWYGVEINLDQSLNINSKLSFKVKTESLIELLSIINHITPISYEINGKKVKIAKR